MYNEAFLPCSIIAGGPPTGPELAPAAARTQRATMAKAHLNLEERIELEAALRAGDTQASVAARFDRSAGTISREVALNGGLGCYRAAAAHRAAQARRGAARRSDCAVDEHPPLRAEVHERLRRGWSPEEIAGILKRDHPDLPLMHTSHESIYRYVYVVARGELQRSWRHVCAAITGRANRADGAWPPPKVNCRTWCWLINARPKWKTA
jgi:IS30 family transposase